MPNAIEVKLIMQRNVKFFIYEYKSQSNLKNPTHSEDQQG